MGKVKPKQRREILGSPAPPSPKAAKARSPVVSLLTARFAEVVQIQKCSNTHIHTCTNTQLHNYINIQTKNTKKCSFRSGWKVHSLCHSAQSVGICDFFIGMVKIVLIRNKKQITILCSGSQSLFRGQLCAKISMQAPGNG